MGSQFSKSFLKSFEIHRAIQSLGRATTGPIELASVVAMLKREGIASAVSDEELSRAVVSAARDAGVPLTQGQ